MRGRRPELKAIDGGKSDNLADLKPPAPPVDLPQALNAEWAIIVADLQARGLLEPSMTGVIVSYLLARWLLGECAKAISRDGAFCLTKAGEPKPHPESG